jgi:hypothetical protein
VCALCGSGCISVVCCEDNMNNDEFAQCQHLVEYSPVAAIYR